MAGGVGTSKRQKRSVLLTRLAIGSDPSNPKYKPKLHLQNQDDRLFVIDLEAAQNSLEFTQTANGSVVCFDTVPSEFHTKIINLKDEPERFGKDILLSRTFLVRL